MNIEGKPKPVETIEAPETESEKKESILLNFDAIKDIIISQIGNKAKINRLEIEGATEGAKLSAEIDAGMLGGKISIEGFIVNTSNEIVIQDLNVDARGYIKSRIESNLSNFGSEIKKYFEKQYKKSVSSIQIVGSNLVIGLENTLETNKPQENKTQMDQLLEFIDNIKDPWERTGSIEDYCKDLIRLKRYEDARRVARLLKGEKGRNATIDNIDRIEKSKM